MGGLHGRVWVFGDNISTDEIVPARYLMRFMPYEKLAEVAMEPLRPGFYRLVSPGDILVAGTNFGCGSSREEAPRAIAATGISCVVAESFGRIFYRNAINVGLPVVECKGLKGKLAEGDEVEVDIETGRIVRIRDSLVMEGDSKPELVLRILRAGGLIPFLRAAVGRKPNSSCSVGKGGEGWSAL